MEHSERFTELHREEKREEGDRGEQEKRGNPKERDRSRHYSVPYVFSTAQNTQRDSQSWVEKRRGRDKREATWWRKRRVRRGREQSSQ